MATPSDTREAETAAEQYQWLRARPDNWRKQLWLKGRSMPVGTLIYSMRADGLLDDPEAAAADFALPVEQVQEALAYYARYRDVIEADAEEEKRWLVERDFSLA